jgi:hypothetical protein
MFRQIVYECTECSNNRAMTCHEVKKLEVSIDDETGELCLIVECDKCGHSQEFHASSEQLVSNFWMYSNITIN